MIEATAYIKIFTTLLAIVNPLGNMPVFVSLTDSLGDRERQRIASTTSIAVALILTAATLIGKPLLTFFGISIDSFRVGGGILLLLMATSMMQNKRAQHAHPSPGTAGEAEERESIAVVPIAMPLLAGPGAISTVIIYADMSFEPVHISLIIASSIVVAFLTWCSLKVAAPISKALSRTGICIATRLMGLLLAAIAIEFITGGLVKLLPGLAG